MIDYLRVCINCGSIKVKKIGFCKSCFDHLEMTSGAGNYLHSDLRNLDSHSLRSRFIYRWEPDKNKPLSKLIENLKGKDRAREWSEVATLFCNKILLSGIIIKKPLFIPVGNATNSNDHAFCFAHALAAEFGTQTFQTLTKHNLREQKGKSKRERAHIKFKTCEKFTDLITADQQIVLVDDVVTTGNTVLSAFKALSYPQAFEVWSFASRALARV